ncbi:MAG: hypothetical protein KAQ68_06335 [Clostridiales bacterium]|nr:hypothetical protein [Clostridiales bacterium]
MKSFFGEKLIRSKAIKVLFVISGIMMTFLLSNSATLLLIALNILLAAVIFSFMAFKSDFIEKAFSKLSIAKTIITFVFTLVASTNFTKFSVTEIGYKIVRKFEAVIGASNGALQSDFASVGSLLVNILFYVIALFALFILFCWLGKILVNLAKDLASKTDKIEKYYLLIIFIIAIIAIPIIYSKTVVFYAGQVDDKNVYDIVFSTDSSVHISDNSFLNIKGMENDIRQPLFGLLSMPFSIISKLLLLLFSFAPSIYPISLQIIQVILLATTIIMISRLLTLSSFEKVLFLVLFSVSYPFLLFSVNVEQYIVSVFWLMIFIYYSINKSDENNENYLVAATGSLITSGILLPLMWNKKDIKQNIIKTYKFLLKFVVAIFIFGRIDVFVTIVKKLKFFMIFSGVKVSFYEKILQYTNFIASCFIKPRSIIVDEPFFAYRLFQIESVNILGFLFLAFAILGFVLNRKDKYAKICISWVAFSFVMLCFIGWGTAENGLILYTLYFGWAFVSLLFMAIKSLLSKYKCANYIVLGILIIVFSIINFSGILQILKFGIAYYPA